MIPIFLGSIGATEMIVILVIVLLLFGGKKIPEMMKGIGKGVKSFKDGMNGTISEADKKEEKTEE